MIYFIPNSHRGRQAHDMICHIVTFQSQDGQNKISVLQNTRGMFIFKFIVHALIFELNLKQEMYDKYISHMFIVISKTNHHIIGLLN